MRRELGLFFCAVQFLTRIPVPDADHFQSEWMTRSAKYFPAVGQIVGAVSAGVMCIAAQLWPGWLPAIFAVASGVLITGAFHEDGLADTADGLGGGQDKSQRLAVMKDSRLGTFGALTLILVLSAKVAALSSLNIMMASISLVAAHGTARAAAVIVMHLVPYAGDVDVAKVRPAADPVSRREALIAAGYSLWPLAFLPPAHAAWGLVLGGMLAFIVTLAARRLIGGQTGDVLGAVEQVFEVGFLLGVTALLPMTR